MKKFIKILAPILMFSLFASYSFAEKYAVENPDIVPGIEVTTEIWDGIGEMKIKKLKYEIEENK